MKYFLDTEFLEGAQKKLFGRTKPAIDLISIGIVGEDGREFYAISNEFNLKEAWNRWDKKECCNIPEMCGSHINGECEGFKREYWIRDNVLRPIYNELIKKERYAREYHSDLIEPFSYKSMKRLIRWNGKSNKRIAEEAMKFIYGFDYNKSTYSETALESNMKRLLPIEVYGYYSDYDWTLFCSLFGTMKELPKYFPMYCRDLKQAIDEKAEGLSNEGFLEDTTFENKLNYIKAMLNYPKQENEHNALSDARWSKKLYDFIKTL